MNIATTDSVIVINKTIDRVFSAVLYYNSMPHNEVFKALPAGGHHNWRVMIIGGAICTRL